MKEQGLRYNQGRRKWSLVHFESIEPMIEVLEFGAKKYAPKNWMKGLKKEEILESMQRHLAKLMDGEENDGESGLSHMGHIQCNAMFYNYMIKNFLDGSQTNSSVDAGEQLSGSDKGEVQSDIEVQQRNNREGDGSDDVEDRPGCGGESFKLKLDKSDWTGGLDSEIP